METTIERTAGVKPGIHLSFCREYRTWLEGFARSQRSSQVALIDRALSVLAIREGFASPPERNGGQKKSA